ncbi:MAG: hypothetical protein P8O16_03225 [Algoriphagus sp.]|uniref:hypothetical protein n=1 Tax=Algoriphagus sp. TaxID=1872435 RepID=UPI0026333545|nr:hypothetical protein [Algoriphagus sp.]MDG1276266.1 hypothetical protein [Algoriphagus sp.]
MKQVLLLSFLFMFSFSVFSQTESEKEKEIEIQSKHSLAFVIGHARIGQGRNAEGDKEFLAVPSLVLDYNYWINDRWAVGLHTDFLNEKFYIENEKGKILERNRPIAPALSGVFKPSERWAISLGMGKEFSNVDGDFTLTRLAIEYGVEIRKGWEVFGVLSQDFRWTAYNVTTLGLGLSKKL